MRSQIDAKIESRGTARRGAIKRGAARSAAKKPAGGQALQRLFHYRGKRDPALNEEVVAAVPVPKSARPAAEMTAKARAAPATLRVIRARAPRRAAGPAQKFAEKIVKAANALTRTQTRAAAPGVLAAVWEALGPANIPNGQTYGTNRVDVIGRVAALAIDPSSPAHLLCAAAGGGIWESFNEGGQWAPRTDAMPSLAIGAVAFDPQNSKIVYAGSGEGNFYANLGAGVYKSVDGGTTWSVLASAPFIGQGFYDLVVDPKDGKFLYAATTTGFYVSTNGGSSWSVKRAVRCWDISLDPAGGATAEILAAFADGLFVSTNRGSSFTAVALPGAPSGAWVRLAVDRVKTAPDVAYAFGARATGAYLARRQGTTWKKLSLPATLDITQAWYDWCVAATPDNKGQVFIGAIDIFRGDLQGSTWRWKNISTQGNNSIHPDQHCVAFAPNNTKLIYAGNDGGIYRSANSGASWRALNNGLGITEISYMAGDPTTSKWLLAGTQDNGTIRFDGSPTWTHSADGDGGDCGVNPLKPNECYHSFYNVSLEGSTDKGNTWTWLAPPGSPSLFYPPVEVFGRTVVIGATSLVVSRTGGSPWTVHSLGLTGGDMATAMHMTDPNTIFVGTRAGRVVRVTWTGSAWTNVTLTSPFARYVSDITVDPSAAQRLWVTSSQVQTAGGLVFRSDNGGTSWVNCSTGLPPIPMNSIVVDPADSKRVWVAADVGVYQTRNLGTSWTAFATGLPNAMAADLIFHKKDRKLFCGTRNRGVWVISVPATPAAPGV
jgi:photosystem II stability/assembly factor-like uncharacterized protein